MEILGFHLPFLHCILDHLGYSGLSAVVSPPCCHNNHHQPKSPVNLSRSTPITGHRRRSFTGSLNRMESLMPKLDPGFFFAHPQKLLGDREKNNSYLVKQFGNGTASIRFRKEPNNLCNLHSFKHSGLANKKTVTIQPGKDQSVLLATTKTKKKNKPASFLNKSLMKKEFHRMAKVVSNQLGTVMRSLVSTVLNSAPTVGQLGIQRELFSRLISRSGSAASELSSLESQVDREAGDGGTHSANTIYSRLLGGSSRSFRSHCFC
ncbi:hypothetical protein CASFOL_000398 [Castilleja foliolosa]|uniref:Ribosomal eL28/Mak16 domain-containing protein n=1 Tax=Castilleja foliolosa TaxID=1961234 RepID=A0ABD3EQR3_9LAMI